MRGSVFLRTMTTTKGLSQWCRKVRIAQPLLDPLEVCKLEPNTFPRTLMALAERSHPLSARRRECLKIEGLQSCLLTLCELAKVPVALECLFARKPALLFRLSLARAWAAPNLGEVAPVVLRTHVRVFERLEAGADAAIEVLLGDPSSLTYRLVLACLFLDLVRGCRRI